MVSEAWLVDSIQKKEAQPLEAYDILSDLSVDGKGIPWDKRNPSDEALESLSAEVCIYIYVFRYYSQLKSLKSKSLIYSNTNN